MNGTPALSITDVRFTYGATEVLKGASLEVRHGEILDLVGSNGAGKSTLLNVVSGVLRPAAGQVCVDGVPLEGLSSKERAKRVAVVAQNPAPPPGFSSLDVVLMGRNPHLGLLQWESSTDIEVCKSAMELTGTWEFAERPIASLSGGEKQRVFIARALAQEADLLLLDEPTAHLDIGYQSTVLDMVSNVRNEAGVTVVVAMHDLSLAAQYCDRVAVLDGGVITALGTPAEVLTQEVVSAAFGAEVTVITHPDDGTPVVLPRRRRKP